MSMPKNRTAQFSQFSQRADKVTISGFSLITKSITEPGTYTSGLPFMPHAEWLRNAVHLRRLDAIAAAVRGTSGETDDE